ncbi:hypothetical protein D9V30_11015 [Mycetocola reblochoni]|uniref:Uncharacterized protein n=1 Tax=Mycetocola reblochoni TaxID=331618 RepID=A0A3L6ZK24_9MICO|nr:hypothetical protein D9V30_11015 [Mycetocola reblochoni]
MPPRHGAAVIDAPRNRFGIVDHLWGAVLGLVVAAPLFGLVMGVVMCVQACGSVDGPGFGDIVGTAVCFGGALVLVGGVVVLVLGIPLGAVLSRVLRPVRQRWIHVLAFAVAGGVTGGVLLPVLGQALSGQLSWVSLAEVPGMLGTGLGQLFVWPGVLVAGVGRWLGMRSADRAARPGVQDRRECVLWSGTTR